LVVNQHDNGRRNALEMLADSFGHMGQHSGVFAMSERIENGLSDSDVLLGYISKGKPLESAQCTARQNYIRLVESSVEEADLSFQYTRRRSDPQVEDLPMDVVRQHDFHGAEVTRQGA
jgi:hypothetical protein